MLPELLETYNIEEILIILFLTMSALAIIYRFLAYGYKISGKWFQKKLDREMRLRDLEKAQECTAEEMKSVVRRYEKMDGKLDMLLESSAADDKCYIVDRHNHFYHQQGWIDDFSLDVLEKRFSLYVKQGGNGYVARLMSEIRSLPTRQPVKREM